MKIDKLIDDSVFTRFSRESYRNVLDHVYEDVYKQHPSNSFLSNHERCFARFSLLIASPLGGCLWPDAFSSISKIELGDIKHIFNDEPPTNTGGIDIYVPRKGGKIKLFALEAVEFALMPLVICCINKHSQNNRAIWPADNTLLAPIYEKTSKKGKYSDYLQPETITSKYLDEVSEKVCGISISMEDYLSAGRNIALYQFDLDVLYYLLGVVNSNSCMDGEIDNSYYSNGLQE